LVGVSCGGDFMPRRAGQCSVTSTRQRACHALVMSILTLRSGDRSGHRSGGGLEGYELGLVFQKVRRLALQDSTDGFESAETNDLGSARI